MRYPSSHQIDLTFHEVVSALQPDLCLFSYPSMFFMFQSESDMAGSGYSAFDMDKLNLMA